MAYERVGARNQSVETKLGNKMYVQVLTTRVFTPLLPFVIIVFALFDANAKPMALKETDENSLDNEETLPAAKMTRVEDVNKYHHHRKRRYRATPFKFHTMIVLWHVTNFTAKLPQDVQLKVFTEAFNKWHVVSRLNFSYTANVTSAHIKISFLTNHFNDGVGGTLAHAYDPHPGNGFPGEIHFDEDENWVTTTIGGTNLRAVALHGIGVAIGIKHSNAAQSVMKDVIVNNNTELYDDDIAAIRWMYGKCEVRDITAVLHDRYSDLSETVLVMNNNKVWRIWVHNGEIYNEKNEKWPKDIRDYYRATDPMYDEVFPLRAAMYIKGDHDVYLFGQNHFIRKQPYRDWQMTNGRFYEFRDHKIWQGNWWGWTEVPEGPLPYAPMNLMHTPDLYKHFLTNNAKFGASFEVGCCYWQHFFMSGTHYKVSTHDFNLLSTEDMSVNFPGAPRNPDASWYDMVNKEWYFFKEDKYYKWDGSAGMFTDRGPISLLWFPVCD